MRDRATVETLGDDFDAGPDAFACLRGYLATLRKQGQSLLAALNTVFAGQPLYPASA